MTGHELTRVVAEPDPFRSILFGDMGTTDVDASKSPSFFKDLNLDQVLQSLTRGREEYNLEPFFCFPLDDLKSIQFRQDVMRDLERGVIRRAVERLAQDMSEVRRRLAQADALRNAYQKMSWGLDAAIIYCDGVSRACGELRAAEPASAGLRGFCSFLEKYTGSESFTLLRESAREASEALADIKYRIHIDGLRVTVGRYEGEPDYSDEVSKSFRRFREGGAGEFSMKGGQNDRNPDIGQVEEQILEMVAALYPRAFGLLTSFNLRYGKFIHETVKRFDREVQFYLAYADIADTLKRTGLDFCYPSVSSSKAVTVRESFDLALAMTLAGRSLSVVRNDFDLSGEERILVVSGPNQGGKTTFARMFGQLHYLARLGLPVPGREARLLLSDNIFTHFEREERVETLQGKLQDELVRMREIFLKASGNSVLIMNEVFASTTLSDAILLGGQVLALTVDLGCLAVYVTFIDELSRIGEATVSMVSTVDPHDATRRTFKVVRMPADGRAYAAAVAEKYGLTESSIARRLAR